MIKLALNLHKFNNYAFFCPVSRLHVTVSNPIGYVNEVTTAILKALKSQTLLDVDGVIDIETGTVKGSAKTEALKKEPEKVVKEDAKSEKAENDSDSKQKTETVDNPTVETSDEKPKRGRKKADAE
ncbi:MAG: hypothetical protein SPJ62_13790 [Inconstantimicrobium porci]|uniref:hypothetical protein n=1 Tax=Inconstantimicrobium porci TaxID=2652291 RepID=UPI002A9189C4|nr:hypothetical protein [Inconstantimicrobium porci]MDY5913041.1 hypothetical protein [Inconstantimicrobium porci]